MGAIMGRFGAADGLNHRASVKLEGCSQAQVFRPVLKGGRVNASPLTDRSVAAIVKRYAELAGLDPAQFAGHSLRAGFITSAAESGAALLSIADQSRHKSLDVLRGYVRRADMFKDHAGAMFL